MKQVILVSLAVLILCCKKQEQPIPSMQGKWYNVQDTSFQLEFTQDLMIIKWPGYVPNPYVTPYTLNKDTLGYMIGEKLEEAIITFKNDTLYWDNKGVKSTFYK